MNKEIFLGYFFHKFFIFQIFLRWKKRFPSPVSGGFMPGLGTDTEKGNQKIVFHFKIIFDRIIFCYLLSLLERYDIHLYE